MIALYVFDDRFIWLKSAVFSNRLCFSKSVESMPRPKHRSRTRKHSNVEAPWCTIGLHTQLQEKGKGKMERLIREAESKGFDLGMAAGERKGYEEGEFDGIEIGREQSEIEGEAFGFAKGKAKGKAKGLAKGEKIGLAIGVLKGDKKGYDRGLAEGKGSRTIPSTPLVTVKTQQMI